MKRKLYLACTGTVLAAAAACASSEDDTVIVDPVPDSGAAVPDEREAAAPTDDAGTDSGDAAIDAGPVCSPAGWCETRLPDSDLTLRDIWAFPGRALAIATSPTLGVRVLEWTADAGWRYIDDNTQNESGHGRFVGKLWAPTADELYFTVAPHTVFRGKRSGSPGTWSWTHWELENRIPVYTAPTLSHPDHYKGLPRHRVSAVEYPALGVFGTNANDVYAWFGNAIYKLSTDDAGLPTWSVEYVADDIDRPDEQLFFVAATGTGPDDLWFAGGRTGGPEDLRACAMLVHKTAAGYRRVADAVGVSAPPMPFPPPFPPPPPTPPCQARPGTVFIQRPTDYTSWLTDIAVESDSSVVALNGHYALARIAVNGDVYSATSLAAPPSVASRPVVSLWTTPTEPLWLGGTNVVAHSDDIWDGGAFKISTIALNGAWLDMAVFRIRASSNSDRWAVGARYALHKTTP